MTWEKFKKYVVTELTTRNGYKELIKKLRI